MRRSTRTRRRCGGDGGAALVEFAIIVPVLFVLIFGIIEFGWAFFQQLDVRHGAREGARLAAVNYKTTASPTPADQVTQIVNETCSRMDSGDSVTVEVTRSGAAVGDELTLTIEKPLDQLTGFLAPFLNSVDLHSTVNSRLEQNATWQSMGSPQACP
jgi:Flp pilus assembly protein TadG